MTRLVLRRGRVVEAGPADDPEQRLVVDVADRGRRDARADVALVGASREGDEVIVNTQGADLGLGSGGFDVVHVNLTRGLDGAGVEGAHVMKLNYTSLQHAVLPVEPPELRLPLTRPVAVISLHGQLAPLAWAAAQARPGVQVGFVQTAGGALPGGMSRSVTELADRGLLAGHLTAGAAHGGRDGDAITTAGALHHGFQDRGWDGAICGPGPGILGSATPLGHGGLVALESAHTALALGCRVLVCPRMSSGDPRERHRGLSHHSATVLGLLLERVVVAGPPEAADLLSAAAARHELRLRTADLDGYTRSGLPATTMGRAIGEDRLFFAAALAAGEALAEMGGER